MRSTFIMSQRVMPRSPRTKFSNSYCVSRLEPSRSIFANSFRTTASEPLTSRKASRRFLLTRCILWSKRAASSCGRSLPWRMNWISSATSTLPLLSLSSSPKISLRSLLVTVVMGNLSFSLTIVFSSAQFRVPSRLVSQMVNSSSHVLPPRVLAALIRRLTRPRATSRDSIQSPGPPQVNGTKPSSSLRTIAPNEGRRRRADTAKT
mmetsp:Transcript_84486/g.217591  ORF Transcript_84486/g.217591 Transcript_84486/m.217591 type:complete len:206 (+) Transcript_84486:433-1050(+)